jgi:hypothetical protein
MNENIHRRTLLRAVGTAAVVGIATQAAPVAAASDAAPTLDASAMTGYWASVATAENGRGSPPEGR